MADTQTNANPPVARQWFLVGIMLVLAAVVGTLGPKLTGQASGAPPADMRDVAVRVEQTDALQSPLPAVDALVGVWPGSFSADDLDRRFEVGSVRGVEYAPGIVGTAFDCSDRGEIVLDPSEALRLPRVTLSVWLNLGKDTRGGQVAALQVGAATNIALRVHGPFHTADHGRAVLGLGAETLASRARLNDGQWHHVVATFDGRLAALYIDGALDGKASRSLRLPPRGRGVLRMCAVDGLVDELSLHERALTSLEVARLHRAGTMGIVRAWTGDEAQPGRFAGNIGYESGKFGFGYRFGGSGHIEVPQSAALQLSQFTLAAWFRVDGEVPHHFALFANENHNCGAPWNHRNFFLGITPKFVHGDIGVTFFAPGASVGAKAAVNDGAWHHAAATYDGQQVTVYVDGKPIANGPLARPPLDDKQELWLGGHGRATSPFRAALDLDDAAIFAHALTPRELSLLAAPNGDTTR